MHLELYPTTSGITPKQLEGTTAIVFDVLRATSAIVTAMAGGYKRVYPLIDAGEAMELAERNGYALGGERGGEKIPGFPFCNSPLEYWPKPCGSNTLVLTTSNGTRAIQLASCADHVYIGSLLNARSSALAALEKGLNISLVCAGSGGGFSFEDFLGAGFVIAEFTKATEKIFSMNDTASAAHTLARYFANDPLAGLKAGKSGGRLISRGYDRDLIWCAQINRFDLAPIFSDGYISVEDTDTKLSQLE